jgi:predicted MFS family arabinose efflux permease
VTNPHNAPQAGNRGGFDSADTAIPAFAGLALIAAYVWHAAIRGRDALIDLSLLRRRGFAAAAVLNLLLMAGLFGSLILIPLYYQVVRHTGTVQTGLLLAPQGIGAALALSVTGPLTDRMGARAVTTAGLVIALLGMLAYTQLGPHTPDPFLAAALALTGLGLGATVTPSMAAAFQAVSRSETPRATSALNAIQRIAGAAGTAAFAILLQHSITTSLPGHGNAQGIAGLSQQHGTFPAPALASAFGATFWAAVALIGTAIAPALLLPGRPPQKHGAPSRAGEQAPAA